MPIYDYKCTGCGEQFELLVLKQTVAECPSCHGQQLEQQLSSFAVSSDATRESNIKKARARNAGTIKEQQVANAEVARHHMEDHH
jgi:putative FmdB family regulatory protein